MTPMKAVVLHGTMVFVRDMADNVELKAMCPNERDAEWLASSLARAHDVDLEVTNFDTLPTWGISKS